MGVFEAPERRVDLGARGRDLDDVAAPVGEEVPAGGVVAERGHRRREDFGARFFRAFEVGRRVLVQGASGAFPGSGVEVAGRVDGQRAVLRVRHVQRAVARVAGRFDGGRIASHRAGVEAVAHIDVSVGLVDRDRALLVEADGVKVAGVFPARLVREDRAGALREVLGHVDVAGGGAAGLVDRDAGRKAAVDFDRIPFGGAGDRVARDVRRGFREVDRFAFGVEFLDPGRVGAHRRVEVARRVRGDLRREFAVGEFDRFQQRTAGRRRRLACEDEGADQGQEGRDRDSRDQCKRVPKSLFPLRPYALPCSSRAAARPVVPCSLKRLVKKISPGKSHSTGLHRFVSTPRFSVKY